jgi:hypothetical protein
MSSKTLFPYRSLLEQIDVQLIRTPKEFSVDSASRRIVRIEDFTNPVEFVFSIQIPVFELSACLPAGAQIENMVQAGIRAIGKAARIRQLYLPESGIEADSGAALAEISVVIDPMKCRGKIEIEPLILLSQEIEEPNRVPGLAYAKSSVIASGEKWQLIFDLEEPPPGKGLPIRWVPFTTKFSDSPERHTDLFALDSEPCIFLNSDKDGLHETLHSKATNGAIARVRDMVNDQIVLQGWTSFIGAAVGTYVAVMAENPDWTPVEILEEIIGWQSAVIKEWAPYIAGNASIDEALVVIHERLAEGFDLMLEDVPCAIQSRFKTHKSFDGMMTEFGNKLRGDSDA